jgi:hypothetical protein
VSSTHPRTDEDRYILLLILIANVLNNPFSEALFFVERALQIAQSLHVIGTKTSTPADVGSRWLLLRERVKRLLAEYELPLDGSTNINENSVRKMDPRRVRDSWILVDHPVS